MPPARLDRACFPRTLAYLERLPGGLDAYPECQIRADFFCQAVGEEPGLADELPAPLAAVWRTPRSPGDWMSVVHFMTVQLLLLEGRMAGDSARYAARIEARCATLFTHPLYRALMQLVSPNLLLIGAGRRFAAFCRGITYSSEGFAKSTHVARMVLPAHVLDQFGIDFFASCFTAAIAATHARDVHIVASFVSPTEARFLGTWH